MPKTSALLCSAILGLALLFTCLTTAEGALLVFDTGERSEIRWGVGIRGAPAFLTHDVAEDVKGNLGPMVSGEAFYVLTDRITLGLNVEWETHKIEFSSAPFSIGDSTTLSVIPFVEFRAQEFMRNSPYVFFGIGANFNSLKVSDDFQSGCFILIGRPCQFEHANTFAFKLGAGTDYFVTDALALNLEFGWKYNNGKTHGDIEDDWNISAFTILIGIRSYWP